MTLTPAKIEELREYLAVPDIELAPGVPPVIAKMLFREVVALRETLESLRRQHRECEDAWYSCPLSPDGCADDSVVKECNCGADEQNARIDSALASPTTAKGEG